MSITLLATRYNDFQHAFGQGDPADDEDILKDLFAPSFTKKVNGVVLVSERSRLLEQLKSVREMTGPWEIRVQDVIPSQDNTKCTLHYIIATEQAGAFDVIAILTAKSGDHIETIEEVYYQVL